MLARAASRASVSALLLFSLLAAPPLAAQAREPVDDKAIEILRRHGLEQSQVMEHLSWMCDVYGPRLTGSPNIKRAQAWAVETFKGWGLDNAHLEEWGPFGRGWQLDHVSMGVVGDNPWPVLAWPKAWSPSLEGRVEADVVVASDLDADSLKALDLTGKIVLLESPRDVSEAFEAEAKRLDAEALLSMANGAPRPRREGARRGPGGPDGGSPGGPSAVAAAPTPTPTPAAAPAAAPAGTPEAAAQPAGAPNAARSPAAAATPATPAAARVDEFRRGFQRRGAVMRVLADKKPLAIIDRSYKGNYGTIFVQGASSSGSGEERRSAHEAGAEVMPQFTIAVEHYNRIVRMTKKGVPVRLAIELKTTLTGSDEMEHNVIAEIPGADPAIGSEVVMMGAHFDSWQAGTGCTDNGCGSAVMMEAMRLLTVLSKELGIAPRRTIRVGLWSGEEQGLLGSHAYVGQHFAEREGRRGGPITLKPEHDKLAAYFNLDNGTGKIRGVYLENNEAVAPIFRAWLRPFHDLEAQTLTLSPTSGTDHMSFDAVGLPGFQFIQDPVAYDARTHHSNMDVWDHAVADDLEQAATIIASFAWHAAQRDQKLPRKPLPQPEADEGAARGR